MGHGTTHAEPVKPEVDKASILQTLAIREEEEIRSLHQAEEKAKKQVVDAHASAVARGHKLEEELKHLEKEILEKETVQGLREAADIRAKAQQELEKSTAQWQKKVSAAADKLFQRIIQTDLKK